jgi:hypothetical protein
MSTDALVAAAKARVFISHCGKQGVVAETIAAFELAFGTDFEAVLDSSEIRVGDDLTAAVRRMIRECDAAIVIVDKRALKFGDNPWVFAESTLLGDRLEIEVIALYVDGVGAEAVKTPKWEVTGLAKRLARTDPGTPGSLMALARQVVARDLQGTLDRRRAGAGERKLAAILEEFRLSRGLRRLRDVAEPIRDPDRPWSDRLIAYEVAATLLAEDPEGSRAHYWRVVDVLAELATSNFELALKALYIAMPFTWVDKRAAEQLPAAVEKGAPVALSALQTETTAAYVLRSSADWLVWDGASLDPKSDPEGVELEADLRALLEPIDRKRARRAKRPRPNAAREECKLIAVVFRKGLNSVIASKVMSNVGTRGDVGLVFLVGDDDEQSVPKSLDGRLIVYVTPQLEREVEEDGVMRWVDGKAELLERCEAQRIPLAGFAAGAP